MITDITRKDYINEETICKIVSYIKEKTGIVLIIKSKGYGRFLPNDIEIERVYEKDKKEESCKMQLTGNSDMFYNIEFNINKLYKNKLKGYIYKFDEIGNCIKEIEKEKEINYIDWI